MRVEDALKDLILTRYKSIREFCIAVDIPYSTIDSILHRGVLNAGIGKVIRICRHLGISADKLADGEIAPAEIAITAITLDEKTLLENYRSLDDNGRELVDNLIQTLREQHLSKSSESLSETTDVS